MTVLSGKCAVHSLARIENGEVISPGNIRRIDLIESISAADSPCRRYLDIPEEIPRNIQGCVVSRIEKMIQYPIEAPLGYKDHLGDWRLLKLVHHLL